jgi:hypothetical protein
VRSKQRIPHGTDNAYLHYGCRCGECTEAHRLEQVEVKARRVAKGRKYPALIPHGTAGGYTNWNCRCAECTEAMTVDDRRKRAARQAN